MSTQKGSGYAALAVGQELEPFEYTLPMLRENELRVQVTHCGLCHTDIQAIDDYYGITTFPFVPGHEIVGFVSETGKEVTGFREGDRVGIGWQARSCGKCEWCLRGIPRMCEQVENNTVMVPYGGFSNSVVADQRFVYSLPDGMPSETAAVLLCAGLSVFSPLQTLLQEPGLTVAVSGIGGLGHLALQFAHQMGCDLTAISTSPGKKEQALAFGADHFIDSADRSAMQTAHFSFDLLICPANNTVDLGALLKTLKRQGRLILLGFPDVDFNSTDLVAHELTISGSLLGDPPTMRAMLDFASDHQISPMIEQMTMSRVNEAIRRVRENKARYRIVLANQS